MKKGTLKMSVSDINPTDNILTGDLFGFLKNTFQGFEKIYLQENNQEYTLDDIERLANDIVSLKENI